MNISPRLLEDGSILRELIIRFKKRRNKKTAYPMLACLRDSVLWVPSFAVLSEQDEKRLLENPVVGSTFVNQDEIRFKPALIHAFYGESWFPVLTAENQGDASASEYSYIPISALECLEIAHSYDVQGICIDPYTLGLALPFEVADMIREIPSHIYEENDQA